MPEEKKIQERKRNVLYLISHYLRDNGFRLTSETLFQEGQLSETFQVCDNIDLETILQEYENYYYLKFQKQPKIIKKVKNDTSIASFDNKIRKVKSISSSESKKSAPDVATPKDSNEKKMPSNMSIKAVGKVMEISLTSVG
ncbi:katanin p60 ATPase-containing subunit A-like 2 [Ctenocephalides felis]|uniref:katanin p60 ATPase-containing subunit A-like 2 n=1 Tax=Ctenocephalides felis TaxID=7515 RepID=UPI000E6E11A2|nr:katanin p60 ATPase-containing subunit A-like 2 [Ctenocephalides felis]